MLDERINIFPISYRIFREPEFFLTFFVVFRNNYFIAAFFSRSTPTPYSLTISPIFTLVARPLPEILVPSR